MREKIELLQEELFCLQLAAGHLGYSMERCHNLIGQEELPPEQLERLESLTSRFCTTRSRRMVKMNTAHLKIALAPIFFKYQEEIIAAYLFGSTAKGMNSSASDIDIAVLLRNPDKKSGSVLKFRLYADLCRTLKRNDVDLVLLSLSGNLILNDEIVRNGEVLYASDDAAREEFELKVLHRCTDFKLQRRYAMGV